MSAHQRPSPLVSGLKGRCPNCGEGRLFSGFLSVADRCGVCGLDFDFADSGDGPAVLIMFPVGLAVVLLWLITDALFGFSFLVHILLWFPATLIFSLALLRPFKGAMINLQFHEGARPGGGPGEREE
ncbi:DUF983 domain-containing protein [Pelagibacterium montanilacus]|uniref:DUF983 domain-containing protein n=1 Tax=Pelagibacterium montanilacus TaxID=2185280 RepID=UPI000F8CE89F|nr:DUF983 domain-containing protein [Pelagibacterium montanilacus]